MAKQMHNMGIRFHNRRFPCSSVLRSVAEVGRRPTMARASVSGAADFFDLTASDTTANADGSTMRVKDVPGFEGLYIVADVGIVIASYRQFTDKAGRLTSRPAKVLKPTNDKIGYRQVALCRMNDITPVFVHRLVAAAFVAPYGGIHVNHKDGDKKNNHYTNLEWCTPQGNTLHYHLRRLKLAELTATEIDEIIALDGQLADSSISRRYNITPRLVRYICASKERNRKRSR